MGEGDPLLGTTGESQQTKDGKVASKRWGVVAFVFGASQAMLCKGLVTAIVGPTLGFLATNTDSNIDQVSYVVSGRAVGVGCGALAFSIYKAKVKDAKPVKIIGIALLVYGLAALSTPFIRSLILLVMARTTGGFMLGYSESGLTSMYLTAWGPIYSRKFVQLNYFMYSSGGFIAPLIAKPFLEMASEQQAHDPSCPGYDANRFNNSITNHSSSPVNSTSSDTVRWTYVIIGSYTVVVAIFLLVMAICEVEEKLGEINHERNESRPEGSVKNLWMFIVSIMMFSFFCVSSYLVYQSYIYSIAVCSKLKMSASDASLFNSLFWGGFGLSRGFGVIASIYFKPSNMIIASLLGTTLSMVIISACGETSPQLIRIATFVFGFFVSTLLPTGISWSSQVTNMTGKYLFVFLLGGNAGTAIMARIAGAVFEMKPFSVVYLITGSCIGTSICFALMNLFALHYKVT